MMISFFIFGLKPEIRRELLVAQTQSLLQAMALARLQENKFKELKQYFRPSWQQTSSESVPLANSRSLVSSSLQQSKSFPLPVKRLSPTELNIRREKGLWYNCDEKYAPGHKCKAKFFLLVGEEEEQEPIRLQEEEPVAESNESSTTVFPEVSMHALAGQISPRTIRVKGRIGNHYIKVLVDSGSTHNFIKEKVAQQLGLTITPSNEFKVYIGNGDFLLCNNSCVDVKLWLQDHVFSVNLFILPIQGAELVLGIQWLELLGPVITDYKLLTMDFQWKGKAVHLIG